MFKVDTPLPKVVPWSPNWSVARFIEKSDVPILPLLLDIVNGLKFLHEQNPPIIHGCLCAVSSLTTTTLGCIRLKNANRNRYMLMAMAMLA